jgi:hypothetical protein
VNTNKVIASIVSALLVLGLFHIIISSAPAAFGVPGSVRKEISKVVWINSTLPYNTVVDVNVTVNSRKGVNIACSNSTTLYFNNLAYWQGLGYATYWDWLNGTITLPHHWNESTRSSGWSVSNGSLAPIGYSDIQFWGDMYLDSGGGVNYTTFMGNTFMADWNTSDPTNQPDIIYQAYWQGNQIKMINALLVPANANTTLIFDVVMTEAGSFTFNIATTPGVSVSVLGTAASGWTVGGVATVLVPYDSPTIQAAINTASPGDTILVHAGTYREEVQINKSLSIIGDGADTTFINGSGVLLSSSGLVKITANSGNVVFSGFTVCDAAQVGVNLVRMCIFTQSSLAGPTYTITDCKLYGSNNVGETEDYGFYMQGGKENIVFSRNYITQTASNPICAELHTGATEISYNTLEAQVGAASDVIFFMTYSNINVTTLQNVSYNTFDMGKGTFDNAHRSAGVTFASPGAAYGVGPVGKWTNMVISRNTFNNLKDYRRGIAFWNNDNTLDNIVSPQVTHNTINGVPGSTASYGISIYGRTINANITCNTIENTTTGIYLRDGDAPGTIINANNIEHNAIGIDWTLGTAEVAASFNWWGSALGPNYTASQYPNSTGDKISSNVLVEPWLVKPYNLTNPLEQPAPICVAYVNPQSKNLTAPALGTVFTINVVISNVTSMYGFSFTLKWNSTLINLTNPATAMRVPTVWGSSYTSQYNYNLSAGNYTVFESAYGSSPSFNSTVTVASLTFQSMYDPLYNNNATCDLPLLNFTIADSGANLIPHLVYNGSYSCNSVKPKLLFTSSEYTAKKVPTEFDANINVTNIVNLQSFYFEVKFDPTLLSAQTVTVPSFSGNPERIIGQLIDTVFVNVTGISPVANGSMTLATIRFRVMKGFIWNTTTPIINSTINFTLHVFNTTGGASIDHEAINGNYTYRPVQGDVNTDGKVDLVDLGTEALVFGTRSSDPAWKPELDLNGDGTINILDIILVARNYGGT